MEDVVGMPEVRPDYGWTACQWHGLTCTHAHRTDPVRRRHVDDHARAPQQAQSRHTPRDRPHTGRKIPTHDLGPQPSEVATPPHLRHTRASRQSRPLGQQRRSELDARGTRIPGRVQPACLR